MLPPEKAGAVEEYDAVVLGSAVYMGRWLKSARELAKKHLSFPNRAVVSAIRALEGDFRNWAQIKDWATNIADALLS